MDYVFYSDFRKWLVLFVLPGLILFGCSTPEELTTENERSTEQQSQAQDNRERISELQPLQLQGRELTFDYESQNTRLSIPLDVMQQEFILDLRGTPRAPEGPVPDSVKLSDPLVQEYFQKNARNMLKHFRESQNLLYRQDYDGAMREIDKSLEILPTADALGLKGTIFFVKGNMNSARYYWGQAVQIDPDIVIPDNPELVNIINEIREVNGEDQ